MYSNTLERDAASTNTWIDAMLGTQLFPKLHSNYAHKTILRIAAYELALTLIAALP